MPRSPVASLVIVGVLLSPALARAQDDPPAVQRGALVALSATLASLQAFDTYSTLAALDGGAAERNPLMQGIVKHPAAFIALKGGVTITSVYAASRLWRQRHRTAALVLLAVTNGAMAAVAVRNASTLRAMRSNGRE